MPKRFFVFLASIWLVALLLPLANGRPARAASSIAQSSSSTPTPTVTNKPSGSPTSTLTATSKSNSHLPDIEHTATPSLTPTITNTPTPSATPTASPTPPAVVIPLLVHEPMLLGYGPDEFPLSVNPLTGLEVDDPNRLDRRPMVIKVVNYPRSVRPQAGLSRADIVYEYYMERGIPRFVAVFYGQDAEFAGPVRSGRFFDEHIFRMYDGIFVFGSADKRVLDYFLSLGQGIVNSFVLESPEDRQNTCDRDDPKPLCRDRSVQTYNNMFVNTAELTEFITHRNGNHRPDLTGMRFSFRAPPEGKLALNIFVRYSLFIYHQWLYSVDTGSYLRFQETIGIPGGADEYSPLLDSLTNEQIAADNVIVLVVPHEYYVKTPTTEIVNILLYGQGEALVFRDGFAFPATWVRPESGVLQLYTLEGEPFPLKPGNTWFQVMSQFSVVGNTAIDWRFTFNPPPEPDEPINPEATPEDE